MRTKALLCAAALAAGALTSMAQVYSANVVGYVNVPLPAGGLFTLLANPLDASMGGTVPGGNDITNLFANASPGDTIFRWIPTANGGAGDFDFATLPVYGGGVWSTHFILNPGEGILYLNANNSVATNVVTFVGQVNQGTITAPGPDGGPAGVILGQGHGNVLGSLFPLGGNVTNSTIGIPPQAGDTILAWDPHGGISLGGEFGNDVESYGGGVWTPGTLQLAPGIGFLYIGAGGNATYPFVGSFTVQ